MADRVCPAAVAALERGQIIDAIRLVRADTGLGLAEAKALVERYQRGEVGAMAESPAASAAGDDGLPPEAEAALARGRVIEAIKIVRNAEGIGLKEAKQRVDAAQRSRSGAAGATGVGFAGPAERRGAAGLVFVLVVILALAWWVMVS